MTGLISDRVKDILYNPSLPLRFSDSDFINDKITSKSIYGYLFIITGGPLSWKLKRSNTIALSTMEAEFNALTEAIRETQWLRNLYSELNILTVGVSAAVAFTENHSQSLFARWTSVVLNLAQPHYVLYEGVLNPRPPSYIHRITWKSRDAGVGLSAGK